MGDAPTDIEVCGVGVKPGDNIIIIFQVILRLRLDEVRNHRKYIKRSMPDIL